ncbi:hypothetical protein ACWD4G_19820 [Streptomyces sp. NPDC002643]
MADLVIRVWLDGNAGRSDVSALKAWLEREKPLDELVRDRTLRIEERAREDTPPGRMGPDWEIVLHVVQGFAAVAQLVEQTKRAADAWRTNRSRVERGEPPTPRIEPPRDSDEPSRRSGEPPRDSDEG